MINKFMQKTESKPEEKQPETKPNEKNGVVVSSHIRIFDPNTKEELVNKRAS